MENKAIEKLILMERVNELNRHRPPVIDRKIDKESNKTFKYVCSIPLTSSRVLGTQLVFNKYLLSE